MTSIRVIELVLCTAALSAFGWGMVRFFHTPSGYTPHTRAVAALGFGSAVCHLHALWTSTIGWTRGLAAIGLYLGAIALFGWAIRACGPRRLTAIFEPDVPRLLVREGPYRFVRHPFYVAYTLSWLAGWVASGSWLALGSTIVMGTTYVVAATSEERKFRESPLAAQHETYCRQAGFMVPRLLPLRSRHRLDSDEPISVRPRP